ncbi:hypothetical protein Tco_0917758, partial [Tanacetum coccineum]
MVKLSFALNVCKESSDTDEAAQYGGNPKSLTFEIHHDGCFTPTPSRSYVGGQVSSVDVIDIDELCLHDLKEMVVKLGFGVADLMYYYFLRYRLGLDYGLHPLNVDVDMLEMAKFKGVAIAVDSHLRKAPIEINSSLDVNKNLTPVCHRNLIKEWEQPTSYVEGPIVEEADDPFDGLDEILGGYTNTREEIIGKQMIVHVGNSSTVENVLDYDMLFETEGMIVDYDMFDYHWETDDRSCRRNDTSGSDSEDFYYDPKHDEVFDDDEHILEDVPVGMNNFNFNPDPKHDLSIVAVEVQEHDLDVIDYDSFGSDLDDGIDFEIRIQLRELRRIGKEKNQGPNKYYFYLGQQFANKEIVNEEL